MRLLAAAYALRERLGHRRDGGEFNDYRADLDAARVALGTAEFDQEWTVGAQLSAEEALAFAARAGFVSRSTRWDDLTPAECRVVELVGEGLTNRDIARRLGISPHTVQSHLRHVSAKLALPGRAALVGELSAFVASPTGTPGVKRSQI